MLSRSLSRIYGRLASLHPSQLKLCDQLSVVIRQASTAGKSLDQHAIRTSHFPKKLSNAIIVDDPEGSTECEDELADDLEHDFVDSEGRQFRFRDLLYPDSKDETIQKLNSCLSPREMMDVFMQSRVHFTAQHITQFIILLWSLTRGEIKDFIKSPEFELLLGKTLSTIGNMNSDEITCSLLYLQRLGVDSSEKTMQELLCRAIDLTKNELNEVPLSALSRLTVALSSNKDIYSFLAGKDIIPHIVQHLKNCSTSENFRLLTICMQHLHQLISKDVFALYQTKLQELIDNQTISSNDIKCIVKAANFLNFPYWSQSNTSLIRSLLILLNDQMSMLSCKELEIVFRVLQSQLEPSSIIPELKDTAQKLFESAPSIESLSYAVQLAEPNRRQSLTATVNDFLSSEMISSAQLQHLFKILRSLKIANIKLCNKYWSLVCREINSKESERETFRLARHYHRYMHFNNNLGGTYRHREFEKIICNLLLKEIESGLDGMVPSLFARAASFIIAYGGNSSAEIPNILLEKLEGMAQQFSISDCMQLSRGLQIALEMRFRNNISASVATQINAISNVLDECAKKHLEGDLSLPDLNCIVRTFINRKASRKTSLFQKAMDRYKNCHKYWNSRIIRDLTYNFNSTSYVLPEMVEDILQYIYDNRDYVTGDTVEKVLTCCYNIGYMPENIQVLSCCDNIIKRDFRFMNSLSIVQSCLALCYYKALSEELINKVFTIDFIQQVEEEIKMCYSKESYPERILNQVMQLNRAVCLDYPETQVPWFQQNYIEAQMSKQPVVQTRFYTDIRQILSIVVGDERLLRSNHVTPYGYQIDFVVHLNKNHKAIAPPKENKMISQISKVAILLQKFDSFCENKLTVMKGSELLKLRHLEILGYKVVHINFNDWNSMYMNMPGAKVNYLKELLQIP